MAVKKNDFIELEFTARANREIFDTTNPEEAKKLGTNTKVKPIIISVGNRMVIEGLDDALIGKEIGKKYTVKIPPEKAFGKRNPKLIKTIPLKVFREKNFTPVPGEIVSFDNLLGKILSVSGGRVITDFNNPLAGKEIEYEFIIKREIKDLNEKTKALLEFFFKKEIDFEIKDNRVILKDPSLKPELDILKEKLTQISGLEFEVVQEEKTSEKKEQGENQTKNKVHK